MQSNNTFFLLFFFFLFSSNLKVISWHKKLNKEVITFLAMFLIILESTGKELHMLFLMCLVMCNSPLGSSNLLPNYIATLGRWQNRIELIMNNEL